jgi:hypothetical protein
MSRPAKLPPALRASLRELFGDDVDAVQIFEHARRLGVHGRAVATTRRGRIYLRGPAEAFFRDPALVLHEYFHVLRQWQPRTLTVLRYLVELLRRGYWDNRFEIEAREFVQDHLHRFRALLSRHEAAGSERGTAGEAGPRVAAITTQVDLGRGGRSRRGRSDA